ncbi:hypothetical protein R1sor_023971 [Riccia sorocarpa]|uniref:Uncharacterized protein n=1 Tax=Riccia sorocarpa TaxID=122646 RepID=A0ABD3GP58_9MARC
MRLVSRILQGEKAEWIDIAEALIENDFKGKKCNRGKTRKASEVLLLEKTGRIRSSRILSNMLIGWKTGKKHLQLHKGAKEIRTDTNLEIIVRAGEIHTGKTGPGWAPKRRRLHTMRLEHIGELTGRAADRMAGADKLEEWIAPPRRQDDNLKNEPTSRDEIGDNDKRRAGRQPKERAHFQRRDRGQRQEAEQGGMMTPPRSRRTPYGVLAVLSLLVFTSLYRDNRESGIIAASGKTGEARSSVARKV